MKKFEITLLILFISTNHILGQKQNIASENSRFPCISDSINHYAVKDLVQRGISKIMTFHYDVDYGRRENGIQYIIWLNKGIGFLKVIKGCDLIAVKDSSDLIGVQMIFDFYRENRIDTIQRPIETDIWMSHDRGYYINVYHIRGSKRYDIRDFERVRKHQNGGMKEDPNPLKYVSDPRVLWVNLFEYLFVQK